MIKNILTNGDSFTYGEELDDLSNNWPTVLSKKIENSLLTNIAHPGSSNDRILRTTIEHIINPLNTRPDLVIIGWSSPGRMEFSDEHGNYDVWPGCSGNVFTNTTWRNDVVEYVSKYHNSKYYYKKLLQQILLLQSFLISQNINHLMLNTLQNDYYKQQHVDEKPWFFDSINKEQFVGFNESGMIEWAYGCPKGKGGHFLDEGHQRVADKIYEHIGNLGWLS
jgi:hypothetical protein